MLIINLEEYIYYCREIFFILEYVYCYNRVIWLFFRVKLFIILEYSLLEYFFLFWSNIFTNN